MSTPHFDETRRFGIREWMSGGWWVALAFSLIIIFVVRSGTVGAPAQASGRSLDSLPRGRGVSSAHLDEEISRFRRQVDLEKDLRQITRELEEARTELAGERARADLLEEGYDGLDAQFHEVADLLRSTVVDASMGQGSAPPASVPMPIEAIYVVEKSESGHSQ